MRLGSVGQVQPQNILITSSAKREIRILFPFKMRMKRMLHITGMGWTRYPETKANIIKVEVMKRRNSTTLMALPNMIERIHKILRSNS